MLRVAVVGNCQTAGIARCLNALSPKVNATSLRLLVAKDMDAKEEAVAGLGSADVILVQQFEGTGHGPLQTERLQERYPHLVQILPTIMFSGFHPDWVPLERAGKQFLSPAGEFHSAIVAAAFANRIPLRRVADLFNNFIFARLGYFHDFDKSRAFLLGRASSQGYELEGALDRWRATGSFMHTRSHPAIRALTDIARQAAQKIGVEVVNDSPSVDDELERGVVLPVYPDIGERIGVPGSWTIKRVAGGRGRTPTFEMDEYFKLAYVGYRELPREVFDAPTLRRARRVLSEEVI